MENTKIKKAAVAILALLIVSSFAMLAILAENEAVAATDYGDLMQYDWPCAGADEGNTGWNHGPAPNRPNVLWSVTGRGSGMVCAFDGMLLTASGTTVYATNPLDGRLIYNSTATGTPSVTGNNGIQKLDDTYFLTTGGSGITIRRIDNGALVANATTPKAQRHPGSGTYFGGHYSTSMKMYFNHAFDATKNEAQVVAHDVSDPKNPTIAWTYAPDSASELLCSGDGKVFLGNTEGAVYALDMNGTRVWESFTLGGIIQQSAMYYNGKLYTSAVSWQITCFDGETGERLWQAEKGPRAFSAYRGAAGDGMIFESTVELDPYGTVGAWDAETGERLWKQPAYFRIHYATMTYADGKVYGITSDEDPGIGTGGLAMPGTEFTCFDAYTGTQLWKLPGIGFSTPSIAYGNLYGFQGSRLYCIGSDPADWTHGFHGNVENSRVAVGQQGPADISTPKWEFQTGGDVYSSPAVVDGKVYVGSADKNWYCLDAYTGEKIWNFTIGHYVRSSAAVVGGRVFTGADDGYFYCLNAETGEKIWQTSAGGFFPKLLDTNEADARSSPIVIGSRLYAGALDGKVYCLSTSDGRVLNTYTTGGPIFGSPAYASDTIYIASADGYMYALNAADLSFKWRTFPLNMSDIVAADYCKFWCISTPLVAAGKVFIGGGVQYGTANYPQSHYAAQNMSYPSMGGGIRFFAFNATTGASIWNVSRAGNTQINFVPAYWNGQIYAGEFFEVTAMNATDPRFGTYKTPDSGTRIPGNRTAGQWVGYQIQSSVAYADDLSGAPNRATDKIYVGSDIGSVYCLDAATLTTLSVFTAGGNVACSPAIWDGKMYVGTTDGKVYCFDDSPVLSTAVFADADKGAEVWNNETITIGGRLLSNPKEMVWVPDEDDPNIGVYEAVDSTYHPGIPNATILISFNKPDMSSVNVTAKTDKHGYFTASYNPNVVGNWGWVAFYEGKVMNGLTYNAAYTEYYQFEVTAPPSSGGTSTPTPTPTPAGMPVEYIYAAVAVIAIILIAIGAYVFTRRSKK